MRTQVFLVLWTAAPLLAQPQSRTLTLKETVQLAQKQNPDLVLARLDEQKAMLQVRAVAEPLIPRTVAGSGLAWTTGFPLSIEGSAPSIVRLQGSRNLYNAPQSYLFAQTRENARGATLGTAATRDEVALRAALLHLDLEQVVRSLDPARKQVENLIQVAATVQQRVEAGRELPIESKRAALNLSRARQRLVLLEGNRGRLSRALAIAIGLDPAEPVSPAMEERPEPRMPVDESASITEAVNNDKTIKRLESDLVAKGLERKAHESAWKPTIQLVAQYALFSRFNNFDDYYRTFQRHNGQLGASIQIPVFADQASKARAAQAEVDARRIRLEINNTRNRIQNEVRAEWQRIREAEAAREVAKADLDVAREQISVLLAQHEAGRTGLRELEEARFVENERWIAFYEAWYALQRARLELLKRLDLFAVAIP